MKPSSSGDRGDLGGGAGHDNDDDGKQSFPSDASPSPGAVAVGGMTVDERDAEDEEEKLEEGKEEETSETGDGSNPPRQREVLVKSDALAVALVRTAGAHGAFPVSRPAPGRRSLPQPPTESTTSASPRPMQARGEEEERDPVVPVTTYAHGGGFAGDAAVVPQMDAEESGDGGDGRREADEWLKMRFLLRSKRFLLFVAVAVAVVAVAVAIPLAMTGRGTGDNDNGSSASDIGSSASSPSALPSAAPTSLHDRVVPSDHPLVVALTSKGVPQPELLVDPDSYQHSAVRWLAYADESGVRPDSANLVTRYALVAIHYGLLRDEDEGGGGWSPDPASGECSWSPAVECGGGGAVNEGAVKALLLGGRYAGSSLLSFIVGRAIPVEVGLLKDLERLDLSSNGLNGTLPLELFGLTSLRELHLHHNELGPSLDADIGNLTDLHILSLGNNAFTGPVPDALARLTDLRECLLLENGFTGAIFDKLVFMQDIKRIDISSNEFQEIVPTSIRNLTHLSSLDAHSNRFNESLPSEIGQLVALDEELNFGSNFLTGSLPTECGNLTVVKILDFATNSLEGFVPTEMGLLEELHTLDLSHNRIHGGVPSHLGKLTSLKKLLLDTNSLQGTIPTELGKLFELEEAKFHENELSGSVPKELCDLRSTKLAELSTDCVFTQFTPAEIECLNPSCCTCCWDAVYSKC